MRERSNKARFLCRAFLENYDFVYDGYSAFRRGPVANIVPKKGNIVWGALWVINKDDLERLDNKEGYPCVYRREKVIVKDDNNEKYEAWVYLRDQKDLGSPSDDYRRLVVQGARDCGLPDDYIKEKLEKK